MKFLADRLREPSTYAGISAGALVVQSVAERGFTLPSVISALVSLVAIFAKG